MLPLNRGSKRFLFAMLKLLRSFSVCLVVAFGMCAILLSCEYVTDGNGNDGDGVVESEAYLKTSEVDGRSTNCAVVLKAQQGTSYSATVTSEDDWISFTGKQTTVSNTMTATEKVLYLYFDTNPSGEVRTATVSVEFSDGSTFEEVLTQHSYDASIAMERNWAELPVCEERDGYIYRTHYGQLGAKMDARNYTFCFDPEVRASLWVAYPLHTSHMSGNGNRNNSTFGYDPTVDDELQADLSRSYNGWYDRGHQLPAADRKCSQEMMDQTFYATNMTPQQGNFNQNKWGALEGRVRGFACADTLYVVTGAYFDGESHNSTIDASTTDRLGNRCPTPTHYYKALLRTSKGNTGRSITEATEAVQLRAIVFWMEHANTQSVTTITSADCISVAELERRTGFTFFPMIDDAIEAEVKASAVPSLWGISN